MKRIGPLLGVILLGFGGYLLWLEMQKAAPHTPHVYLTAGIMVLGALLIAPTAIGQGLTVVVNAATAILPVLPGGRRSYDPPAPPPPAEAREVPMVEGRVELGDESGG